MTARLSDVEALAKMLGEHRVNYHSRNVGGETSSTMRYTSCEGCDWLGGWRDEAGWEAHLATILAARLADATLHSVGLVAEDPNPDYGVYPVEYPPYGVSNKYIDRSLMEEIKEKEGPTPKFHDHD